MSLNVDHLKNTADSLEQAIVHLQQTSVDDTVMYDLFRNSAIKGFELSLETTCKLLRKALKLYVGNPRRVDQLVFNDVFRYANQYGLMDSDTVERWLHYRRNRNTTAHDYGAAFAETTLAMLPDYLKDVREMVKVLNTLFREHT